MTRPQIARGRTRCFAFVEEATAFTLQEHAATNFVRHEGASIEFGVEEEAREDRCGGLAPDFMIQKGKNGSWAFPENHLCPSGSVGGTSEYDALLKLWAGSVASVASTTVTSGTASAVVLGSIANLVVGDLLYFATTNEVGQVDTITTGTSTVTLKPALSKSPTGTEVVVIGKQFRPAASDDTILTASVYIDEDHAQRAAAAAAVNEGSISFAKGESVKAAFSGPLSGQRSYAGTTPLKTGVNDSATTFELNDGEAGKFSVEGGDVYALIGTEVVKVTAVSNTLHTLTVTRGQKSTGAAAHLANAEISPYFITGTKVGNPVVGIAGGAVLEADGERYVPKLQSASMTVANNIVPDSDYGFGYDNHFRRDGARPRSCTWEMELRFDQEAQRIFGAAARKVELSVCLWAGNAAGSVVAIGSRKVHMEIPSRSDAGGEDITLTISGTALASAAGADDEFRAALL